MLGSRSAVVIVDCGNTDAGNCERRLAAPRAVPASKWKDFLEWASLKILLLCCDHREVPLIKIQPLFWLLCGVPSHRWILFSSLALFSRVFITGPVGVEDSRFLPFFVALSIVKSCSLLLCWESSLVKWQSCCHFPTDMWVDKEPWPDLRLFEEP